MLGRPTKSQPVAAPPSPGPPDPTPAPIPGRGQADARRAAGAPAADAAPQPDAEAVAADVARLAALEGELAEARAEIERLRAALGAVTRALRAARTDPLTGLADRRRADRWLARAVTWAHDRGRPLALIMLDLDRFKAVNDAHGHPAGDALLRRAAGVLGAWSAAVAGAGHARPRVARFGGDEFLVLLPGLPAAAARAVADRLHADLTAALRPDSAASLGLAGLRPGDTPELLLARADAALVRAKRLGRDRVEADDLDRNAP